MLCIKLFKRVKVNIVQAVQNGIALGHLYGTPLSFVPGTLILTGPIAQEILILNGPIAQEMHPALKVKDTIMKGI
jgi:hypothetical protein